MLSKRVSPGAHQSLGGPCRQLLPDATSAYAYAHVACCRDTETEVLLLENDINTAPFSPAVHACVPPLPWAVSANDLADPQRCGLHACPAAGCQTCASVAVDTTCSWW